MPKDLHFALIDLATGDYSELPELFNEFKNSVQVVERLLNPVPTWRDNMGRFVGKERLSIGSLRLKRDCDREVTLDDEGEIDEKRAGLETLRMRRKICGWKLDTRVGAMTAYDRCCRANSVSQQRNCDACRFWDQKCIKRWSFDHPKYVSGCEFCFKNDTCCTYRLARLNNDWLSQSLASMSLADPVLSLQATRGLTPPNTMRSTQGSELIGSELRPTSTTVADNSLSSITDLVPTNTENVALSGVGDPSYTCGNLPHHPPNTPLNPQRCLSRPALPVAEPSSFIPTDGPSYPCTHLYPKLHTTLSHTLELTADMMLSY